MKKKKVILLLGVGSLLLSLGLSITRAWNFMYSEMIMFIVYAIFTAWSMFRINKLTPRNIFLSIFIGWGLLNIPLRFVSGTAYSVPNFIMDILGMLAGYAYYHTTIHGHRIKRIIVLTSSIIILLTIYPIHEKWLHYLNFGNITGVVEGEYFEPFHAYSFDKTKPDLIIGQKADQYYIIDLWHSRCGVCIKKFPQFQNIYDKFKSDSRMIFCAISTRDKAELEMTRFNYSFPFFYCDKSIEKYLTAFPTYLVIYNKKIIFRGDTDLLSTFLTKL